MQKFSAMEILATNSVDNRKLNKASEMLQSSIYPSLIQFSLSKVFHWDEPLVFFQMKTTDWRNKGKKTREDEGSEAETED